MHIKALLNSYPVSVKGLFSFPGGSLTVASNVFVKLKELILFQFRHRHLYIPNRLITSIQSYAMSCNDERVSRSLRNVGTQLRNYNPSQHKSPEY